MHDIRAIRDDRDSWVEALSRRPAYVEIASHLADDILAKDKDLRELLVSLQQKQARRNEASKLIGKAKAQKDEAQAAALMAEVAGLKDDIQKGEEREREMKATIDEILAGIPNLPAADVPDGADENANVPMPARAFGSNPGLNNAKEHFDLGEALGMMDFERAAKVSGSRFVYLTRGLARLERALGSFMLDLHTDTFGYTEVNPPLMVRSGAMFGTGQLPKFAEDLFEVYGLWRQLIDDSEVFSAKWTAKFETAKAVQEVADHFNEAARQGQISEAFRVAFKRAAEILFRLEKEIKNAESESSELELRLKALEETDHKFLIPTAEVPLTNYVRDEILNEATLPYRFTAYTPCFRAEAGAAGKDTRGMIRMHQFSKVELVSITTPEKSNEEHERMTDCAQEVLKRLNLHHRVVTLCAGDMGFAAKKTYDIEVWLPGQKRFREISSCSNCGDFQARRMGTRYRGADGKVKGLVHTLNGSGLAVGRTLIAIMENYQEPDGSIRVPDVLVPYMGGMKKIEKVA